MASVERDGALLSYEVTGAGPFVVLQHPLTSDGRAWHLTGILERIVDAGFCCIVPDALGHGASVEAPVNRVGLRERTHDVLAVVDAVGAEKFHYLGYSMGGWIGTGLIRDAADRLLSVSIAGWDPIDGGRRFTKAADTPTRRREFTAYIDSLTRHSRPGDGVIDARVAGYLDTYDRLFIDLPSITALIDLPSPLTFAVGRQDPYHQPVEAAAEALGVDWLTLPGDHVQAFLSSQYRDGLVAWLRQVSGQ